VDGNAHGAVRGIDTLDDYRMHEYTFAIGLETKASGGASLAQGIRTFAEDAASHAEGLSTQALGRYSHAEGEFIKAAERAAHAEGYGTQADLLSHAEGYESYSGGIINHAEGYQTRASGNYSHVEGYGNFDHRYAGVHLIGRYGLADMNYSRFLGNGPDSANYSLAAKIHMDGNAYIDVAWHGGGADYAEMFETESGQPIEPGYFVTFGDTGDKIRIAGEGDRYILGVVSRTPGFVGRSPDARPTGSPACAKPGL
jgi:hypothetical protein